MKKITSAIGNFFYTIGSFIINPFILMPVLVHVYLLLDFIKAILTDGYTVDAFKYLSLSMLVVILLELGKKSEVAKYHKEVSNRNKNKK